MNEDMKVICGVKDKIFELLQKANEAKDFSMGDIDWLYKATKAIKNSCEIEDRMEDGGYSQTSDYSSANRGKHLVRGHYSRDNGRGGNYGGGSSYASRSDRSSRGGYSRDDGYSRGDGRSEMMEHLEMAMDSATEEDRETIKRFMRQLENA